MNRPWTNKEEQLLREMYPTVGAKGLVHLLKRSDAAIQKRAAQLRVSAPNNLGGNKRRTKRRRLCGLVMTRRQEMAALAEVELPPEKSTNIYGQPLERKGMNAWRCNYKHARAEA